MDIVSRLTKAIFLGVIVALSLMALTNWLSLQYPIGLEAVSGYIQTAVPVFGGFLAFGLSLSVMKH